MAIVMEFALQSNLASITLYSLSVPNLIKISNEKFFHRITHTHTHTCNYCAIRFVIWHCWKERTNTNNHKNAEKPMCKNQTAKRQKPKNSVCASIDNHYSPTQWLDVKPQKWFGCRSVGTVPCFKRYASVSGDRSHGFVMRVTSLFTCMSFVFCNDIHLLNFIVVSFCWVGFRSAGCSCLYVHSVEWRGKHILVQEFVSLNW